MTALESGGTEGARQAHPTVLVSGPREAVRAVALATVGSRTAPRDGVVVVASRSTPEEVVDRLTAGTGGVRAERVVVLDRRPAAEGATPPGVPVRRLSPPTPTPRLAEAVANALADLDGEDVGVRHFLHEALDGGSGGETPYDRAHDLAMAVGAEDGVGVFGVETGGRPATAVADLAHLFDVHVETRLEDGEVELRWTGLLGETETWVPLGHADLAAGAFR